MYPFDCEVPIQLITSFKVTIVVLEMNNKYVVNPLTGTIYVLTDIIPS